MRFSSGRLSRIAVQRKGDHLMQLKRESRGAAVPIAFLAPLSCKNGIERNSKIVMHIIDRRQFFLLGSSSGSDCSGTHAYVHRPLRKAPAEGGHAQMHANTRP